MACRVGITTNVEDRRRFWEGAHPTLNTWETLGSYNTKTAAQAAETRTANDHGCVSQAGGGGPEYAIWTVYHFYY